MSHPTFKGTVHLVEETKTYGQKGFRKRLVVLEQNKGRFTNYVPFEFVQDDCSLADDLNVGDQIEIAYRLSGRKWQRDAQSEVKYFLNAEAISFKRVDGKESSDVADANDALSKAAVDDDEAPF